MYQLNAQQLNDYRQNGFCVVDDYFSQADIALMRQELQRLRADGLLANKCQSDDGEAILANLQICPLSGSSEIFRSLPFFAPVKDTIAQILQNDFAMQLDQIFVKPAGHGYGTNWHQDNAYFDAALEHAKHGVGMWIAIDDANVSNGTMRLIPNSHHESYNHVRDMNSDHFITCNKEIDESQAIPVEVAAGGVAFFNFGIAHCTKNNPSNKDRAGLALHFVELPYLSYQHAQGYFPIIKGPSADNGLAYWGKDLSSAWEAFRISHTSAVALS